MLSRQLGHQSGTLDAVETVPPYVSRLYTPEVLRRLASVKRAPSPQEDAAADPVRQRHIIFSGEELAGRAMRLRRAASWSSNFAEGDRAYSLPGTTAKIVPYPGRRATRPAPTVACAWTGTCST